MMRAIVAVIVGYVVMFALVFGLLTAAYLGMGAERAFEPSSYDVSGLWLAVSFVASILAAIGGGYVCAWIARRRTPPIVLASLVLVFGLLIAIPACLETREPKARSGEVANLEAMKDARTPPWVAILNPVIGAAGALLGARLRGVPAS